MQHPHQRGMATLAVTLTVAFLMLLGVAIANRSTLFEVKTSANQYRAAQAREAAEAGLDWAVAQLNAEQAIGDDCMPTADTTALSFRSRPISALWADCVENDNGWSCRCPASGNPRELSEDSPIAFAVRITRGDSPNRLQVSATGASGRARTQLHVTLERLPGLDTVPAAALTVRGDASLTAGTFSVHHTDPDSNGLTLQTGGAVAGASLQLISTPGTPGSASLIANDELLAHLSAPQLFASVFRLSQAAWREQPVVHELDCSHPCDAALAEITRAPSNRTMVWLRGGLHLDTPLMLGTPQRPLLLVADGPVVLNGAAVVHGVVYGTHTAWSDTSSARIHGAVILAGDLRATGSTSIHHDEAVLQALHQRSGTYARLPNSWRDF